jgi:hypothetical protein
MIRSRMGGTHLRRPKTILLAATLAVFAISSIAAPASAAASTKLTIINGFPGKTVDVCVNGKEVKSGLGYGKFVRRSTKTAKANVKFYARSPKVCKGSFLGKKTVSHDYAIVILTKRTPRKVVVFQTPGPTSAESSNLSAARVWHAADIAPVEFWYRTELLEPFTPSDLVQHSKGNSLLNASWSWVTDSAEPFLAIAVRRPGETDSILRAKNIQMKDGSMTDAVLIGTNATNAAWVLIRSRYPIS